MVSSLFSALIAGFFGTVIMTISQLIEISITKRKLSNSPAIAFSKLFGIKFEQFSSKFKRNLSYAVHFSYGTIWALAVYLLYLTGIQGILYLTAIYFFLVTIQGWMVVYLLRVGPPVWKWGISSFLIDSFHHFMLAVSTVLIFVILI